MKGTAERTPPTADSSRRILAILVLGLAEADDADAFTLARLALRQAEQTGLMLAADLEKAIEACNRTRERLNVPWEN